MQRRNSFLRIEDSPAWALRFHRVGDDDSGGGGGADPELVKQLATLTKQNDANAAALAAAEAKLQAFEGLDIDSLKAAAKKVADIELEQAKKDKTVDELLAKAKSDHDAVIAAKDAEHAKLRERLDKTVVKAELSAALAGKVPDVLMDYAIDLLSREAKVVDMNGEPVPMWGTSRAADHVAAWAETPAAKYFTFGNNNSGGGSNNAGTQGGSADAAKVKEDSKYFRKGGAEFNRSKQAEIYRDSPEHYDACKAAASNASS